MSEKPFAMPKKVLNLPRIIKYMNNDSSRFLSPHKEHRCDTLPDKCDVVLFEGYEHWVLIVSGKTTSCFYCPFCGIKLEA